jgi:hypothetical protein
MRAIREHGFWPILFTSLIDKCSVVASNLTDTGGRLRRSTIYDTYVTYKKREVSYSLGMAFAKLHSEKLLNIRNLVHLEFLKQQNSVTFVPQPGNKRPQEPDSVGQAANGTWHLFEAKGTTYENTLAKKISDAKTQVNQISTIRGQPPATRSVSATYIGRDRIFTRIEDPSDTGSSTIDFDDVNFIRSYYAPFLMPQQEGYPDAVNRTIDGVSVSMFEIENRVSQLSIGFLSKALPFVLAGDATNLSLMLSDLADLTEREGDGYSFGPDGFVVGFKPKD